MERGIAMERRITVLEEALLGDPRPHGHTGLLEIQRAQGRDIKELKSEVAKLGETVGAIVKTHSDELLIRQGEQKMLRTFRNIIFGLLAFVAGGGGILAGRILSVLKELSP